MEMDYIRTLRLAHPFKPFKLVLVDGRQLIVDKPYYLGIAPDRKSLLHSSEDGGFEILRPESVDRVDFMGRNAKAGGAA